MFYIEHNTMTKWRKDGDTFQPIEPWLINRDPQEVLQKGFFTGPYKSREKK